MAFQCNFSVSCLWTKNESSPLFFHSALISFWVWDRESLAMPYVEFSALSNTISTKGNSLATVLEIIFVRGWNERTDAFKKEKKLTKLSIQKKHYVNGCHSVDSQHQDWGGRILDIKPHNIYRMGMGYYEGRALFLIMKQVGTLWD